MPPLAPGILHVYTPRAKGRGEPLMPVSFVASAIAPARWVTRYCRRLVSACPIRTCRGVVKIFQTMSSIPSTYSPTLKKYGRGARGKKRELGRWKGASVLINYS